MNMNTLMDIYDTRTVVDFQKFTFSGNLRQHVYKVLDENIKLGHADYACYWSLELVCSGLVHSLWQTLFESAAKHINRGAPNVFPYLVRMYEKFSPYEQQYSILSMTDIRNNADVRTLICEVSASLAFCKKNKLPSFPKIKPEHDFQQITVTENLKAPSANYARHLMKQADPLQMYIPMNELYYSLRPDVRDSSKALYWCAWMLKYSSRYKKEHKEEYKCAFRGNDYVDDKFCFGVLWMIWDAIRDSTNTSPQSGTLKPYMDSLFKLHCLRWTPSSLKTRLVFLTTAIMFLCESTTLDIHYSVPPNITAVHSMVENIPQWIQAILQAKKTFS
uniref:Uncharacterized protein n=1 Tax=viral metagenome TaxID=1070528 RepID=A0A6C0JYJ6_9ZZZZ